MMRMVCRKPVCRPSCRINTGKRNTHGVPFRGRRGCKQALGERETFMPIYKRIMEQRAQLKSFQSTAGAHREAPVPPLAESPQRSRASCSKCRVVEWAFLTKTYRCANALATALYCASTCEIAVARISASRPALFLLRQSKPTHWGNGSRDETVELAGAGPLSANMASSR